MYNMYPVYAKFTAFGQQGGLVFPSASVLKIVKATEVIFRRRVIEQGIGISTDINLFGRIQSAVLEQYGPYVFNCSTSYFYEHSFGAERDQLSWSKLYLKRTCISEWQLMPKGLAKWSYIKMYHQLGI